MIPTKNFPLGPPIHPDIMKKVKEAIKEKIQLDECLSVHICPRCGGELYKKIYGDDTERFACFSCPYHITRAR